MHKEEEEVAGRSVEMLRARERINTLISTAQEASKHQSPRKAQGREGQPFEGTRGWLPVLHKEWTDNHTKLRECKANRELLSSFVNDILERTNHWRKREL